MPRLSRVSPFAIAGLLIATLLAVSACRGQPSLPSAATRTPTRAATSSLATSGAGTAAVVQTAAPVKTTPAAPGTPAASKSAPVSTGAAAVSTGAAAVSTPAAGMTPAAASPTKAPVTATTAAPAASGTRTSIPIVTSPNNASCAAFDSALQVSASATQVKVDQPVTITAKLANNGCGTLAWPQYYLRVNSHDGFGAVLQPWRPAAISHAAGVNQGQADTAVWVLQATTPGQADVTVSVVFQAQTTAGSAGPWNGTSAKPVRVTVTR